MSIALSRRRFLAALAAATTAILAACTPGGTASPGATADPATSAGPTPTQPPTPTSSASSAPTGSSTAELRRKIGRMLIVGFRGTAPGPSDPIMQAIAAGSIGGVILFDRDQLTGTAGRNITSPAQLTALTSTLRSTALRGEFGPAFLIVVDQEGGRVARLNPSNGYPATASEAELGALNDVAHTTDAAILTAITLAGAGIGFNLAPVVDLNVNPANPAIGALGRSFSADPAVVITHATAMIEGQRGAGIKMAIKHFPGEGSASGNTDDGIVDVTATWSDIELQPFRNLISLGLPDAVMVGHIVNGQIDPDRPASLSQPTIGGLLRRDLGWDGVVISDDLQAPAITQRFGDGEAIVMAIEAGVDLLLFANQQVYEADLAERVVGTILEHVSKGRIPESRLDESVARIEAMFAQVE